ncbi:MAG: type II toxin-antitoxin system PemK/MazF family toxin [Verrucomicrobia bacterium]|nr:type II toxin-antitoxin system PemK/MazF family toxin [Verrucomicrobiota bacterium]MBU4291036.1 type II toxin-antitoxin system PemK/MazF family toxin [Verrucomicrobiota bacterium]MBU4429346.1 type II toxin-antitoxin system PemK/MazF family toxin [Verrucomicrobiota bacterium]MBU4498327.1 type II toxin-antitoxin system PemK/MazF family toxin [Verrucomicrobiota bacterium]MCG2679432.1 type II toxin-antitoxin system PemK/MazF family toxin [Kiritimatiellia bacterium]
MEVNRFDVFLVILDPTVGHEIKGRHYPTRMNCTFQGIEGQIVLDQIRTVDKVRLVKKLGQLSQTSGDRILDILTEMFQK